MLFNVSVLLTLAGWQHKYCMTNILFVLSLYSSCLQEHKIPQ